MTKHVHDKAACRELVTATLVKKLIGFERAFPQAAWGELIVWRCNVS